jgi:acyl-coenzyme A thioesterase PaaI-like protein
MTSSSPTFRLGKQLAQRPGGSRLFSAAAMIRVPYFASIVPHVRRMEPGYAEVTVPKWFFVYNHLGTVHAIASCNAAELAMGMLMEATVPTTHRWIPKAMTVQYLDKATTSLRAAPVSIHPTSPRSPTGSISWCPSACSTKPAPKWCTPTSPRGSRLPGSEPANA